MSRMLAALKSLEGWRAAPAYDTRARVELAAPATSPTLGLAVAAIATRSSHERESPLSSASILALPPGAEVVAMPGGTWARIEAQMAHLSEVTDALLADEFPAGQPRANGRSWQSFDNTARRSKITAQPLDRAIVADCGAPLSNAATQFMPQVSQPPCELPAVTPQRAVRELAERIASEVAGQIGPATVFLTAIHPAAISATNLIELAVAIGEGGDDVLVIDLQRSSLVSTMTGRARPYGLGEVLAGSAQWQHVICETNLSGVALVGAGPLETVQSDIRSRLEHAWLQLPAQFRFVLIAGGTIDRQLMLQIAGTCRATYLTVELGRDRRRTIGIALAALQAAHANVRGAIVLAGGAGR